MCKDNSVGPTKFRRVLWTQTELQWLINPTDMEHNPHIDDTTNIRKQCGEPHRVWHAVRISYKFHICLICEGGSHAPPYIYIYIYVWHTYELTYCAWCSYVLHMLSIFVSYKHIYIYIYIYWLHRVSILFSIYVCVLTCGPYVVVFILFFIWIYGHM